MSLIEILKHATDFRSSHGKRHQLWFVLLLIIVGASCGYWGYRPTEDFAKLYGKDICAFLSIPSPNTMPSYSTFRRVLMGLDLVQFAELFNRGAADYVDIEPDEWLSSDGKSIRSSVTHYNSSEQDFISLVSLFSQKRGQVVCALPLHNKQMGEEYAVRQMLASIDLQGAVVATDALHTKKRLRRLETAEGTI